MRILVLSDLYPPVAFGGYEMECAALVDGLRGEHDLLVSASDFQRDAAGRDPQVLRDLPFQTTGARGALSAPTKTVRAIRVLRRQIDGFKPDLVYVSSAASLPQAVIAEVARRRLPLVLRFAELWYASSLFSGDRFMRHLSPGDTGVRGVWARTLRGVNRAVPRLRFDAPVKVRASLSWNSDTLRELAGEPAAVDLVLERTIYPATLQAPALMAIERAPAKQPTIAYVGRVTLYKGADVACRMLARLRQRHDIQARLVIVGTVAPDMRRDLDSLCAQEGIADQVEFLGHVTGDALARVLSHAHALVVPSVRPEAFGLAAVEAALARVPVVASRSGGIPEALREDRDALFFEPGDAEGGAAAIARSLADPAGTERRVASAYARAQDFSLERWVSESEALIRDTYAAFAA